MKKFLLGLVFSIVACNPGSLPVDGSMPWDLAGRFGIEMKNDCNISQHGIGLGGCAFRESELSGNLNITSLWNGSLSFVSYNCKNFTLAAASNADNVIQLRDMYTALNHKSCTFDIARSVSDGGITLDRSLLGRFGIKIIRDNEYYAPLKFAVNDEMFNGIGWYQRNMVTPLNVYFTDMRDATLTLYPNSERGSMSIRCGDKQILQQAYESSPIVIELNSSINCDYEIEVTHGDNADIEEAMYMHMVHKNTTNITVPAVRVKRGKIRFTFTDLDASGKDPVVVGVQVNTTKCVNTSECEVANTLPTYTVKAVTTAGRFFWGEYNVANNNWSTK